MCNIPTYTVVTTNRPADVVALTLMEFNRTVIIGTTISGETTVTVELHKEVAGRQTVRLEHLQQQANISTQVKIITSARQT